jgi:Family of unknown function (DUF6518)
MRSIERSESQGEATGPSAGRCRVLFVVVTGLVVGLLTSILQKYLGSPWDSLVNAASPWLTPMFAAGTLWRRPAPAAVAGLGTGLLELVGYYVTAAVRGYPAGHSILLFWTACAVIGGPVFAMAGWAWWRTTGRLNSLGTAALPAAFLSEAAVSYGLRLHYLSSAILFAAVGILGFVVLGWRRRQYRALTTGLLVVLPVGVIAEVLLGLIYNQSF